MKRLPTFGGTQTALIEQTVSALELVEREVRLCNELSLKLFGVSAAQLRVLCKLVGADGQTVGELAVSLSLDQSSMSQLLVGLTRKKLVDRQSLKGDDRVVQVRITSEGKLIAARAQNIGRPLLVSALAEMPRTIVSELGERLGELGRLMESQRVRLKHQA